MRLAGQVALVTGAGRGIGRAVAAAFAREGAFVVLAARSARDLGSLQREIEAAGGRALAVPTDVRQEPAVAALVSRALAVGGRIDCLVTAAGLATFGPVADAKTEDWDQLIAVNLRGVFLCCRAVLPDMLGRGSGRIINLSSQLAYLGGAGTAHYSASKGGVSSFTRALAREVARAGVLVNAIAPGPTDTAMQDQTPPEWRAWKERELPLGRFATIEEVAASAVFLASDAASNNVGQTLGPNSGDVMP